MWIVEREKRYDPFPLYVRVLGLRYHKLIIHAKGVYIYRDDSTPILNELTQYNYIARTTHSDSCRLDPDQKLRGD